jgi:polysaccharide biosynthesis protein PslH
MEKMNVLSLVSYKILPAKMGGQKGIALFNQYFAKEVNLICVATKNNDTSLAEGYSMLPILSNSKFRYINIFYFFSIRKLIKKHHISKLIIEHPYYGWLGFLLKALRFKSTCSWWWKLLWYYEKWTYGKATHVFFITEEDLDYAVKYLKIKKEKCTVITYGIEVDKIPTLEEKQNAKNEICSLHSIKENEKILLFNGTLDYAPNLNAVEIIVNKINPALHNVNAFKYKIIICGKGLPNSFKDLNEFVNKNIIYAGFVNDIKTYFLAADIFINPVIDGGGIKTKLVEALGYNVSVISTMSGAIGAPINITENKMSVVGDDDWESFCKEILTIDVLKDTPTSFFEYFYWGEIVRKAKSVLTVN